MALVMESLAEDLAEYLAETEMPRPKPIFQGRRWTIGGVVSMSPAPPPRRQSVDIVGLPSSRWRHRRYSLESGGVKRATSKFASNETERSENADPQLRFVTMRGGKGAADGGARTPGRKGLGGTRTPGRKGLSAIIGSRKKALDRVRDVGLPSPPPLPPKALLTPEELESNGPPMPPPPPLDWISGGSSCGSGSGGSDGGSGNSPAPDAPTSSQLAAAPPSEHCVHAESPPQPQHLPPQHQPPQHLPPQHSIPPAAWSSTDVEEESTSAHDVVSSNHTPRELCAAAAEHRCRRQVDAASVSEIDPGSAPEQESRRLQVGMHAHYKDSSTAGNGLPAQPGQPSDDVGERDEEASRATREAAAEGAEAIVAAVIEAVVNQAGGNELDLNQAHVAVADATEGFETMLQRRRRLGIASSAQNSPVNERLAVSELGSSSSMVDGAGASEADDARCVASSLLHRRASAGSGLASSLEVQVPSGEASCAVGSSSSVASTGADSLASCAPTRSFEAEPERADGRTGTSGCEASHTRATSVPHAGRAEGWALEPRDSFEGASASAAVLEREAGPSVAEGAACGEASPIEAARTASEPIGFDGPTGAGPRMDAGGSHPEHPMERWETEEATAPASLSRAPPSLSPRHAPAPAPLGLGRESSGLCPPPMPAQACAMPCPPPDCLPPGSTRPRGMRRSGAMLRLYTSPRTPADSTRRVRRASNGQAVHVAHAAGSAFASSVSGSGLPQLPSGGGGGALPHHQPLSQASHSQLVVSPREEDGRSTLPLPPASSTAPGRAVYDLHTKDAHGNALKDVPPSLSAALGGEPTELEAGMCTNATAAVGGVPSATSGAASYNWSEVMGGRDGSPPFAVTVRAEAAREVAELQRA